jgi:hypothetical protein
MEDFDIADEAFLQVHGLQIMQRRTYLRRDFHQSFYLFRSFSLFFGTYESSWDFKAWTSNRQTTICWQTEAVVRSCAGSKEGSRNYSSGLKILRCIRRRKHAQNGAPVFPFHLLALLI